MTDYSEKLKHPKWQRKRLEIMKEAGFVCQHCNADDKTLHVHHGFYARGHEVWQYPDDSLHCVCEDCHRLIHTGLDGISQQIACLPVDMLGKLFSFLQLQPEFIEAGMRYAAWHDDEEAASIKRYLQAQAEKEENKRID